MLTAELESLAHAPLADAGAVSVLRWHALSGYSLQADPGDGRAGDDRRRDRGPAQPRSPAPRPFDQRLAHAGGRGGRGRGDRDGGAHPRRPRRFGRGRSWSPCRSTRWRRSSSTRRSPEDKQRAIALGQASRGIKLMLRARGEPRACRTRSGPATPSATSTARSSTATGRQLMIGFGPDADALRRRRPGGGAAPARTRSSPATSVLDATAHDWLADEFSRGTWAIHRPGWYEHHHAAMRRAGAGRRVCRVRSGRRLGRVHRRRHRVRPAGRRPGGGAQSQPR